MNADSSRSSLGTGAEVDYVDNWLESNSKTDEGKATFYFNAAVTHFGSDNLRDPYVVELRALVTQADLPPDKNITSQAFKVTFVYECHANTVLTPVWTDSSSTTKSDPSFIYLVNAYSSTASTAIERKLTTTGNKSNCNSRLLTTIQMLISGNWVEITASNKPGWLTTASVSNNVARFIVNTADYTALDDALQTDLELDVQHHFRAVTEDYWSRASIDKAFTVTFKHQCHDNVLVLNGAAPSTTLDYEIKAAGSTASSSWRSKVKSTSLSDCDRHLDTYVEYEENGTWIDIWNDLGGSTSGSWKTWLSITRNGAGDVSLKVQSDDETNFTDDLVTPEFFNLRVRTRDKWSDNAAREKINTVKVTFTFDCSTATLSTTPMSALTGTQNYVVQADGSTPAITDTTTLYLSVSGCVNRNKINTLVEIWHQGAFVTFLSETSTDPNSVQSTYPWLTATLRGSNPNDKADISIDSDSYTGFPDNLIETQTYYFRVKTWDKWTPDTPFYQEVTVNFSHECIGNVLTATAALPSTYTYTIPASGASTAGTTQTTKVTGSIAGCHNNSSLKLLTQVELFDSTSGDYEIVKDESGTAAGVCAGGANNNKCLAHAWIDKLELTDNNRRVNIIVKEGDFNAFSNKLAEDVTFRFRVRTRDRWSTDVSNPVYQTLNITITHQCRSSQLTQTSPASKSTPISYTVEADGNTAH